MRDRISQLEIVKQHLTEKGEITSWEAIQNYRITRLSEYIRQLRRELYWAIESIPEKNERTRWTKYKLLRITDD